LKGPSNNFNLIKAHWTFIHSYDLHKAILRLGDIMSKRKVFKIDLSSILDIDQHKTIIRPKSLDLTLENRGKDFKLEYKEVYNQKKAPENPEWVINTVLNSLKQVQESLSKHHKYIYYQTKQIKKGYHFICFSDDSFALLAVILSALLAFGVREKKEDSSNASYLIENILKWISKANLVDS